MAAGFTDRDSAFRIAIIRFLVSLVMIMLLGSQAAPDAGSKSPFCIAFASVFEKTAYVYAIWDPGPAGSWWQDQAVGPGCEREKNNYLIPLDK